MHKGISLPKVFLTEFRRFDGNIAAFALSDVVNTFYLDTVKVVTVMLRYICKVVMHFI